ncbi:Ubiquitin-conjugating enzyme E2 [Penicillium odoratum]|uniref:Ubiquitin-conjugating enzyme E2 n=1 Tax=Penicillium odoratum TaxID=1167516 RepID=UPI0025494B40|nr:Ubiquitin-conjugating enzyme E2 [Penicillium odoratum]KAJ5765841.1 Ubiquitin-conjugating enzyme E2 [Penicillium odoratum]
MTIHYCENNVRQITALLIGPPDTPYAFGFYQLNIQIPPDYPARPPAVTLRTTNMGRTRFGPNLYSNGKICLTWPGPPNEAWSPAQGLESVLLSIQSLLSTNPYTLEPGFENLALPRDKEASKVYSAKIAHENLRLTVIAPLEVAMGISPAASPSGEPRPKRGKEFDLTLGPFVDFCKQRFLWYREQYKMAMQAGIDGVDDEKPRNGQSFPHTSFESSENCMSGEWNYPSLMRRFEVLERAMMKEINHWPSAGLDLMKRETSLAVNLRAQQEQVVSELALRSESIFDLALVDDNPFLWLMTYFGRSGTPVDDGVFQIRIHISPDHPKVQPRVFMETPLFHVRVSTDQMLIYLPVRADEMIRHIEGIMFALEEKLPICNPLMVVNQHSARLCWGTLCEQKEYTRRLRRSVADSLE